jgi:hypothetical protein
VVAPGPAFGTWKISEFDHIAGPIGALVVQDRQGGTKQHKGPALALLNVVRRKGFEAILKSEGLCGE